jgi:hypothetical protein
VSNPFFLRCAMLQPSVTPNSSSVDSKVPLGPRSDGGFHFSPVFLPKNHDAGMCIAGGEHREHHVAQSTVRRLKRVVFVGEDQPSFNIRGRSHYFHNWPPQSLFDSVLLLPLFL